MVNKTWSLVPLPTGWSAIGCRWTFKLKRGPDGSIQRHKARFVAKGYSQRPGVDYLETYSPVVKLDSLRCILSIASHRNLNIMQLDVQTAFQSRSNRRTLCQSTRRLHRQWKRVSRFSATQKTLWSQAIF
jgi:hypothetical protein